MKLESQVVRLDLAKRLEELGVKRADGLFWWHGYTPNYLGGKFQHKLIVHRGHSDDIPAFTVAELGEMLTARLKKLTTIKTMYHFNNGDTADLSCTKNERTDEWIVSYYGGEKRTYWHGEIAYTEADARAKMLIYLLENKLITL